MRSNYSKTKLKILKKMDIDFIFSHKIYKIIDNSRIQNDNNVILSK